MKRCMRTISALRAGLATGIPTGKVPSLHLAERSDVASPLENVKDHAFCSTRVYFRRAAPLKQPTNQVGSPPDFWGFVIQ